MQYLNNIDLAQNQLQNALFHILSGAPGSPLEGQNYYNSTTKASYTWNGTAWIPHDASKMANGSVPLAVLATDPLARANHTGTQLANTISNLAATVQAYTLNSFAAPTANVAMGGFTLTGLSTSPNASGQAAEYSWVLNQISSAVSGVTAIKAPVRALIAANIAITGIPTSGNADGVTLVAGDRVLLTGQTTAHQNRIWLVQAGAWTAPTDFDQSTDIVGGTEVLVNEGTTYGGSVWRITNTGAITLGTTSLTWLQTNKINTYSNGNGLDLTGFVFSAKATPSGGLVVTASGIELDTTIAARKYSADIGDGTTTAIVVTHNLNTQDIIASVRNKSTNNVVGVDIKATTVNTATITFATAPAAAAYRVSIVG